MNFKLSPMAESDAHTIARHYADMSASLAERFTSELVAALDELCDEPHIGSRRYTHFLADRSLRSWHLNHFPFIVFYRVDQDKMTVLRILHERRHISPRLMSN